MHHVALEMLFFLICPVRYAKPWKLSTYTSIYILHQNYVTWRPILFILMCSWYDIYLRFYFIKSSNPIPWKVELNNAKLQIYHFRKANIENAKAVDWISFLQQRKDNLNLACALMVWTMVQDRVRHRFELWLQDRTTQDVKLGYTYTQEDALTIS